MQEKDHNYAKELLNYFDIEEKDFINFSDAQIKEISNKFSTAEVLDRQSGVSKGNGVIKKTGNRIGGNSEHTVGINGKKDAPDNYGDTGGCSKILHKCDYEKEEHDIFIYCPKVGKKERNEGCEGLEDGTLNRMREDKGEATGLNKEGRFAPIQVKNFHPTVKPQKLLTQILKLFKTPNPQVVFDPFMGSGSLGIVCKREGVDFIGIEKNEEYFKIAEVRINNS